MLHRQILLSLLLLGACAKKQAPAGSAPEAPPPAQPLPPVHSYHGEFRQALAAFNNARLQSDGCDARDDAIRLQVIEKIEAQKAVIDAYNQAQKAKAKDTASRGGDEELLESISVKEGFRIQRTRLSRELKEGWTQWPWLSWQGYLEQLSRDNLSPSDWADAEYGVRNILKADLQRRKDYKNTYTRPEQWPLIVELESSLASCEADPLCGYNAWRTKASGALLTHISENPALQFFFNSILSGDNVPYERTWLMSLLSHVRRDLRQKKIWTSTPVSFESKDFKNILRVNVLAKELSEETKTFFKSELEGFWQTASGKLELNWLSSESAPFFKLQFFPQLGRALVSWTELTLSLYQEDTLAVLQHEFGHVLGLPDRYWELRDEANCRYEIRGQEKDIMGLAMPGSRPLANDWSDLVQSYAPFQGPLPFPDEP